MAGEATSNWTRPGRTRPAASLRASLFVSVTLLAACDQPAPPPEAKPITAPTPVTDLAEQQLRDALADMAEAPLRKLSAQAQGFSDAIEGLLTEPGEERLTTAQLAWEHLYRSYNEARVLLTCRALADNLQQQRLTRTDPLPILPGYIDSLSAWPGSGLVNDVTVPLTRDALLEQQGATSEAEASVGFQVLQFLLFGEPDSPRQASAFVSEKVSADERADTGAAEPAQADTALPAATDTPDPAAETGEAETADLMPLEDQPERRREYLRTVAGLLTDDLLLLARPDAPLAGTVSQCPTGALAANTRRLIQLENLQDNLDVSGEYLAPRSRALAMDSLWQGIRLWLASDGAFMKWAEAKAPLMADQLSSLEMGEGAELETLQKLHAGLSSQR